MELNKMLNALYKEFKNITELPANVETLGADEIISTLDKKMFQQYISGYFGGDSDSDTTFFSNISLKDIAPFGHILSAYYKGSLEGKSDEDSLKVFVDIISGYISCGCWLKLLPSLEKEDIQKVLELMKIDSFIRLDSWDIVQCASNIVSKGKDFDLVEDYFETYFKPTTDKKGIECYNQYISFLKCLNDLQVEEDDTPDEIKSYVEDLWSEVEPIYEELYRNAIEQGCMGILTPEGYMTFKKGNILESKNGWLKNVYNSMTQIKTFQFAYTSKLDDLSVTDFNKYNYFAKFHALNVFGVLKDGKCTRRWDEFLPVLERRFKGAVKIFLTSAGADRIIDVYGEIKEKMTNCVVIEKFDRQQVLSLKYKLGNMRLEYNDFFEANSKAVTQTESCKVVNSSISQNNVITLFGVFDAKKFASEALFSYQAYDNFVKNGGKVGLDKVIVGRKLNGANQTFSLKSNDSRVTAIFAGSGSGKGVMTLGLLSAIVANNVPFIYLDYKPDMAELLWEIEKQLAAEGIVRSDGRPCRILSIDAKSDMDTCSPVRGHRFGENLPSYLSSIPNTVFAVLPYLKLLQLYYILGSIRANEENKPEYGGAMTFAILDEFQANIKDNLSKLVTTLDSEVSLAKKSKDETYKEKERYALKLKSLIARLANETGTFINTDGRKSQCRAIYLGQNADYSVWKSDKVEEVANLASEWYSKTSYRFFGRNGGTGTYAPSNIGSIAEFVNNEKTFGYWTGAVGAGKVSDIKDWPVFKAYSVLNVNDYNIENPDSSGRCTTGVLNNIQVDSVKQDLVSEVFVKRDEDGNVVVRPEVGFLGLVRKLSGFTDAQLADALSSGYEVIWKVMCKYNLDSIYPDIESYLFDASLESIYTTDEIRKGVQQESKESEGTPYVGTKVFGDGSSLYASDSEEESEEEPVVQEREPFVGEDIPDDISFIPDDLDVGQDFKSGTQSTRYTEAQEQQSANSNTRSRKHTSTPINGSPNNTYADGTTTYNKQLNIPNSPFIAHGGEGVMSGLNALKDMTRIILNDIKGMVGDLRRVSVFRVNSNGSLSIDDVLYQPTFNQEFLETVPFSIRSKIERGCLAELFDFSKVYEFKNLQSLEIENPTLAQGRCRRELGLRPKERYSALFRDFPSLTYILAGGIEYSKNVPDTDTDYEESDGFGLGNRLRSLFGFGDRTPKRGNERSSGGFSNPLSDSRMNRIWDSGPVRVTANALGWTLGVKAVTFAASMFGPWGLLFGALSMAGAYKELKQGGSGGNQGYTVNSNTSGNKGSKKKSTRQNSDD